MKSRRQGAGAEERDRQMAEDGSRSAAAAAADAILVLCQTLLCFYSYSCCCCCCLPARVSDGLWKSLGGVSPDLSRCCSVALICANPDSGNHHTAGPSSIRQYGRKMEIDGGAITCRWNIAVVYWGVRTVGGGDRGVTGVG